jgi:hypothetical protein
MVIENVVRYVAVAAANASTIVRGCFIVPLLPHQVDVWEGGIETGLSHRINSKLSRNQKEFLVASLHVTHVASTTSDAASEMRATTPPLLNVVRGSRTY